jgi:hypothetical protein
MWCAPVPGAVGAFSRIYNKNCIDDIEVLIEKSGPVRIRDLFVQARTRLEFFTLISAKTMKERCCWKRIRFR